jgi:sporulation protein YlmC with PRC-barrel domain
MRLSDLRNCKLKTLDGKTLGRVHEVHSKGGRIVALTCGAGSWFESLTAKSGGRRIAWERVVRIADGEIVVGPDKPERKPRPRAARSRQGIRRSSARPSKR